MRRSSRTLTATSFLIRKWPGLWGDIIVCFPFDHQKTILLIFQQCRWRIHSVHNDALVGTRHDRAPRSTKARPSWAGHCCRAVSHPDIFGRTRPSVHTVNSQRSPSMAPCPCTRSSTHFDGRRLVRGDVHPKGNAVPYESLTLPP